MAMARASKEMAVWIWGLLAPLLLFTLLSGSLSCAAMAWTPAASDRPCCPSCPNHQHSDSERCVQVGCIGVKPVLVPNSIGMPTPGYGVVCFQIVPEVALPEWITEPVLIHPPELGLFLAHRQLLI